jgi:hypothetical protein
VNREARAAGLNEHICCNNDAYCHFVCCADAKVGGISGTTIEVNVTVINMHQRLERKPL